jgi:site-specific recombinase XerC
MEKSGYRAHTIESAVASLKGIARVTNLVDVEAVKGYLASASISECRKGLLTVHLLSTVSVAPEKGNRPRQLKVSSQTIAMLNLPPRKSWVIFHAAEANPVKSLDYFRRVFDLQRGKAVEKLQNPRLCQISFRTLRHFKATMEHHRTKDILHVMRILGHRNIENTLMYTHLVDFESDEYVCKIADTVELARFLIESGFEYVTDVGSVKMFRKRK